MRLLRTFESQFIEKLSNTDAELKKSVTVRKVSKYGVIPASYFPVFSPNTGKKNRPEITPYLDTFHAVRCL